MRDLKLFIDTAKIEEIKIANACGILSGVTTNPSLLYQAGGEFEETIKAICAEVSGPVSVETVCEIAEKMVEKSRCLSRIAPNVVIKIPMTPEGIKAVKILAGEDIRSNVTLVFSVNQALLAAAAGATFISPFVGRIDDIAGEGMAVVREIVPIYDYYGFPTQVIAASIRHPLHVVEAAKAGAHIATIPFKVLEQMFRHPLTDIGIKKFLEDWEKLKGKTLRV